MAGDNGSGTEDNKSTESNTNEETSNTDEVLGEAGKRALEAERKARREAEAKVKELSPLAAKAKEIEEANKTEAQRLADELEAAKATSTQTAMDNLRLTVALEKAPDGMAPAKIAKLAQRLRGADRETLEADAEELFADFGGTSAASAGTVRKSPTGLKAGNAPAGDGSASIADQIAAAEKAGKWDESSALKAAQLYEQMSK